LQNELILVTGGAGYVGSQTCKLLFENGFIPITFDNLSTGHQENVKWGPLEIGDLRNKKDIERLFDKYKFKSVFHFAAKAYVGESVADPLAYFSNNIAGSINLIEEFLQRGGENFVFSSSCATYGESTADFISENQEQNPINPYGFTKLAVEKLLIALSNNTKFKFAILRYFNAAGADVSCELGEWHDPETHVIPLLVEAFRNKQPFTIFGSDFETLDGTAIRDYIHVIDLADAHLAALRNIIDNSRNLIVNVGTGVGTSIQELVDMVGELDPDFQVSVEGRRQGDPARLVADICLIEHELKWKPKHSSSRNILETAIKWHDMKNSRKK
jgi:UDP-glucose-4-epimerase GalE